MSKKRKAAKKSSKSAGKARAGAKGAKKGAGRSAARGPGRSMAIAMSARKSVAQRVAALASSPLAVCESDENLQAALGVLRNREAPIEVRLAALQAIQAASFSVVAFEACRADYIAALRAVADDPDPELRQRVLGILMREQDGYAQKRLLQGLEDPEKALVPPEKALQLLSYDVHADAYQAAREIVSKPPNTAAKREALRLLAADASSAPMFERLLRDKDETPEVRQMSAAALHAIKPDKLQKYAREILLDDTEQEAIRATSLTALTQFGDQEAVEKDKPLLKSVDKLSAKGSTKVRAGARRFLNKYGGGKGGE